MKKTYKIEVDCANCAAKMERSVAKIPGVKTVNISFLTQKINIEADDGNFADIMQEVSKACRKVERGCVIHME